MLSATSHVRVQVEQARMDILRWMRRRWLGVKQEGGFDKLDDWALVEIAHGSSLSSYGACKYSLYMFRNRCEAGRAAQPERTPCNTHRQATRQS